MPGSTCLFERRVPRAAMVHIHAQADRSPNFHWAQLEGALKKEVGNAFELARADTSTIDAGVTSIHIEPHDLEELQERTANTMTQLASILSFMVCGGRCSQMLHVAHMYMCACPKHRPVVQNTLPLKCIADL